MKYRVVRGDLSGDGNLRSSDENGHFWLIRNSPIYPEPSRVGVWIKKSRSRLVCTGSGWHSLLMLSMLAVAEMLKVKAVVVMLLSLFCVSVVSASFLRLSV